MLVLEFVEESIRLVALGLQRVHELQQVLLGEDVIRQRRRFTEQMVNRGLVDLGGRDVLFIVRGIRDRLGGNAADLADRLFQEQVEGRADEQVEAVDPSQLHQSGRRFEHRAAQNVVHGRSENLALPAAVEQHADHIVERQVGIMRKAETSRQLTREKAIEQHLLAIDSNLKQVRSNNRNDAAFFDLREEDVPVILFPLSRLFGNFLQHCGHGATHPGCRSQAASL